MIPGEEDGGPGKGHGEEGEEPLGGVHEGFDVIGLEVGPEWREVKVDETGQDGAVDLEPCQSRGIVACEVGVDGGNEEPEGVFGGHVHEHHAHESPHALTVTDGGVVTGIGTKDTMKITLTRTILAEKVNMIGVATMDVTFDGLVDGQGLTVWGEEGLEDPWTSIGGLYIGQIEPDTTTDGLWDTVP